VPVQYMEPREGGGYVCVSGFVLLLLLFYFGKLMIVWFGFSWSLWDFVQLDRVKYGPALLLVLVLAVCRRRRRCCCCQ